jgi:hypothetical protein
MANPPLTREQVLEELRFLTTVEHAVIVENLSLHCALGHDLPAEDGGATTQQGSAARDQGFALAQVAMFRYKALQLALVEAGGDPESGRATSVSSDSVPETPLVPPDAAQLERFLARAQAIATAVEERYAKLLPAVTSDPVFEDPLLEHVRAIVVEDAPTHTASLVDLRTLLPDGVPAGLLRATRRQASNAFEQRMLDASDRIYDLVLSTLREQFEHTDFFVARSFRSLAEREMTSLDDINRLLVQRGLLPAFTLP